MNNTEIKNLLYSKEKLKVEYYAHLGLIKLIKGKQEIFLSKDEIVDLVKIINIIISEPIYDMKKERKTKNKAIYKEIDKMCMELTKKMKISNGISDEDFKKFLKEFKDLKEEDRYGGKIMENN